MDIFQTTRSYERWMARHIQIVRSDLNFKHTLMAQSVFSFFVEPIIVGFNSQPRLVVCPHHKSSESGISMSRTLERISEISGRSSK
jgi:hypothetical protein